MQFKIYWNIFYSSVMRRLAKRINELLLFLIYWVIKDQNISYEIVIRIEKTEINTQAI